MNLRAFQPAAAWCTVLGLAVGCFGLANALAAEPQAPPVGQPTSSTKNLPPPQPTIVACANVQRQELVVDGSALIAGSDGWIFRTYDLTGEYDLQPGTIPGLTRFVQAWASRGTRVALVLLPPRGVLAASRVNRSDPLAASFDPAAISAAYRIAIREMESTGAVVPDLLAESGKAKLGERFFFRRDHHWTPEGAKLAMNAVISRLGASLPAFTPVAFQNVLEKYRALPGVIAGTMQKECGYEAFPPERFARFHSVRDQQSLTAEALLGDAPPAEVVLAGSSHANKGMEDAFNVAGWLRTAAGTDVLNIGVDGGGFSTGLLNWMDSDGARLTPPKLLVWEIAGRVPDGLPGFFREALPTMAGECANPSDSARLTLGADEQRLFAVKGGPAARDSFVFLRSASPEFVEFRLTFETADRKKDAILIRRNTRIANNGRFFVAGPDTESALTRVVIRGVDAVQVEVEAHLCVESARALIAPP